MSFLSRSVRVFSKAILGSSSLIIGNRFYIQSASCGNEKVPCHCKTFHCGGKSVSIRTRRTHIQADVGESQQDCAINVFDSGFNANVYQQHWSSKEKISHESSLTVLEATFEIMRDFVFTPSMSKDCVSRRLQSLKTKFITTENKLPSNFSEAMSVIEPFLTPIHKYHVCINDCLIFRNQFSKDTVCQKCGENRYFSDGTTARRNFSYLPITPRLRRMFATGQIRSLLNQHWDKPTSEVMSDLHDSKTWQEDWFGSEGEFGGERNSAALALCMDGVNPFSSQHIEYSLCPIEISLLNFPPKLRKSACGIFIAGIIPGNGTGEAKSYEPYMELLVEELLSLQKCKMQDENGKLIEVSIKLLNFVLDFPAIGKVLHLPGSARSLVACPFCDIVGINCSIHKKTLFLQNRRFLDADHVLRKQQSTILETDVETRGPPLLKRNPTQTREKREEYDKLANENQRKNFTKEHGVKGTYKLMDLSYHKFEQHLGPDIMHTIKNIIVNLCKILSGKVPEEKIHRAEEKMRGTESHHYVGMTQDEIGLVDERLQKVIFPLDSTGCKKSFLTKPGSYNPTHAWHELGAKNVLMFLLRDCLQTKIRRSLTFWLSTVNRIEQYTIHSGDVKLLKSDQKLAAALMERDFPLSFNVITTHLLQHEVETLEKMGPAHGRWMYPYERYNSLITRRVKSRKHPEASAARTVRIMDWVIDVILAQRLPIARSSNPTNELERLLMRSHDELSTENLSRKRKPPVELGIKQSEQIERIIGQKLDNLYVNELHSYRSERLSELGSVLYNSESSSRTSRFSKSSRFVFLKKENVFGEIVSIYEHCHHDKKFVWFVVSLFPCHEYDGETRLPFASMSQIREEKICTVNDLSEPLIVAIEDDSIWFISIRHDSSFEWLSNHISNLS